MTIMVGTAGLMLAGSDVRRLLCLRRALESNPLCSQFARHLGQAQCGSMGVRKKGKLAPYGRLSKPCLNNGPDGIFKWPDRLIHALLVTVPRNLLRETLLCTGFTFSSQFSGMGTMEHALAIISQRCKAKHLPVDFRITASLDIDSECQQVLTRHGGNSCIFADIVNFTCVSSKKFMRAKRYKSKLAMMMSAPMNARCWCVRHQKECPVLEDDVVGGGSPCTAHSMAGKREGWKCSTFQTFLCWIRRVVAHDTIIAIHENVPSFPDRLMEDTAGATHHIFKLVVEASDVGYGKQCRRNRKYHILVSKKRGAVARSLKRTHTQTHTHTDTLILNSIIRTCAFSTKTGVSC